MILDFATQYLNPDPDRFDQYAKEEAGDHTDQKQFQHFTLLLDFMRFVRWIAFSMILPFV